MAAHPEETIARFEPINQRHAIAETVFFCEFDPPLAPPVIERLIGLEFDSFLKAELPIFRLIQDFGFDVPAQGDPVFVTQQNTGFERKKVGSDGQLEWALRVVAGAITVHCLDYTEWVSVWPKAKSLLYTVINKIGVTESSISGLGLKYLDRFTFEGDDNAFDVSLLFNPQSELINASSFQVGQRWHCHTGWFDNGIPGFEGYECLNRLNIDSVFAQFAASNEQKPVITIEHTGAVRGVNEELPSFAKTSDDDNAPLNALMNHLHDANKAVLLRLLTERMSQRISLAKGGSPCRNLS